MKHYESDNYHINIETLQSGLYFIHVYTQDCKIFSSGIFKI